nr:uncharacterized protein CTRU02_14242 [Colletotrichum truncatum]KAF6782465.1 hypothetical protein CTRU02_14242 [Colletotrichum truncatum]
MPCTRCFRAKRACQFAEGANRCQLCAQHKKPCDGLVVASTLSKLNSQRKEWDEKEEEAGEEVLRIHEELARLQSDMALAVSRLSRIRQIRKKVVERQKETFARGMQELDAEDGLLSVLDAHEAGVVGDLRFLGVPNDPSWSSFGVGEEFADLGPLVGDPAGSSTVGVPPERVPSS